MKLKVAATMVVAILISAFASAEVDRSTPENTVKSFVKAFTESNFDGLVACVKDAKHSDSLAKMFGEHKGEFPQIKAEVTDVRIDGSKATCIVTIKEPGKETQGQQLSERLNLEQNAGNWQIVAVKSEPVPGQFVNALATALIMPEEMLAKAKESAKKAACLSNIKQLATAFMMLASDNDDIIKVKSNAWKKAIMPYTKNEAMFACPLDPKGTVSYSINPAIAGIIATSIKDVTRTVLLYEGSKGKLSFRHGGYAAVAFTDGHAQMVNAEQAKKLIWKP